MIKKFLLVFGVIGFAFVVLIVSIMQSSSVTYSFMGLAPVAPILDSDIPKIDYKLPYAGSVLPDNPLWVLKAARDRLWYLITSSPLRRAELALLFSDKRLAASKILFERGKTNLAISTLTKGEKYLEIAAEEESLAGKQGYDIAAFLADLAASSLKHREVIEGLIPLVPEEGRPIVVKTEDYAKNTYKNARDSLNSRGLAVPIDPFGGD